MKKNILLISLVLATLVLSAYDEPPPLGIAPSRPLLSVPSLPLHAQADVTSQQEVLTAVERAKSDLDALGGDVDAALMKTRVTLDCRQYVNHFRAVAALPLFNTFGGDAVSRRAADNYNWAINNVDKTSIDMYLHCRNALEGTATDNSVQFMQWGLSRKGVADSLQRLEEAMAWLRTSLSGTLATCSLTLSAPYISGGNVRTYVKMTCSARVSSIRLVLELAKRPNGNTGSGAACYRYDNTLYNVSWHEAWVYCPYNAGYQWQSRASGYAPGWSGYQQSNWTGL